MLFIFSPYRPDSLKPSNSFFDQKGSKLVLQIIGRKENCFMVQIQPIQFIIYCNNNPITIYHKLIKVQG